MRFLLLLAAIFSLPAFGQKLPPVHFNHLYVVIDSLDLVALQKSDFIKNKFGPVVTRVTSTGDGTTWIGTYINGADSYLEIFDPHGTGEPSGNAGIGFSVDGIGELNQ